MATTEATDPWGSALSLRDLADATIEFLEGRLSATPLHHGRPDTESEQLIPSLVAMNRAGFVTTGSQPGLLDQEARSAQRAFVEGICDEGTATRIESSMLSTDLVAIVFGPGSDTHCSITVTTDGGDPFTFLGRCSTEEVDVLRNGHRKLDIALDEAWTIQVFDPVWGRNDYLWTSVRQALGT